MEKAALTRADGSRLEGRGAVARQKGGGGEPLGRLRHELGALEEPLYVFTGCLPPVEPGDRLEQGGRAYAVLHGQRVFLGDTVVCTRAVLERWVDDAGL